MSREGATKFYCDFPDCQEAPEYTAGEPPVGWQVFRGRDYGPLHIISVNIDGLEQSIKNGN